MRQTCQVSQSKLDIKRTMKRPDRSRIGLVARSGHLARPHARSRQSSRNYNASCSRVLAQSSNVPFLQSRDIPFWLAPEASRGTLVRGSDGQVPPTKGSGESERLTEDECRRTEPSRSHATVERETGHTTPSRGATGHECAPSEMTLACLPRQRRDGASL